MPKETNALKIIRFDTPVIARHEAGHAVLAVAYGSAIQSIFINPAGNCGLVKFDPSMEEMESRLACDFAGPLSQVLKYVDSTQEYGEFVSQSIILEDDLKRMLAIYNALNWGKDMLLVLNMIIGMREHLKPLEIALRAYLQRDTVQNALAVVEEALLRCYEPAPAVIQALITDNLAATDYAPRLSRPFRGFGLSGPVRRECS